MGLPTGDTQFITHSFAQSPLQIIFEDAYLEPLRSVGWGHGKIMDHL